MRERVVLTGERMPKVVIKGVGTIDGTLGRRLVLAVEEGGVDILHRCGGNARCATCRVEILGGETGPITEPEELRLAQLGSRKDTTRLSCQVQIRGDVQIDVCNRLSTNPELGDAGPTPIEWPVDHPLPPD